MTRKDYILLAEFLGRNFIPKESNPERFEGFVDAVQAVTNALAWDNPRFDSDRFITKVFTGVEK